MMSNQLTPDAIAQIFAWKVGFLKIKTTNNILLKTQYECACFSTSLSYFYKKALYSSKGLLNNMQALLDAIANSM